MHLKSILKCRFYAKALKYWVMLFSIAFIQLSVNANPLSGEKINYDGMTSSFTVTGKVIDKSTGKGIAGATIKVKGENTATATDGDGKFTINVNSDKAIIIISSVGFGTVEQAVSASSSQVSIELSASQKDLDAVIVTALGIQKSVKSLTYSAQKIGGDQINEVRDANFTNTLSGKVAGLTVTNSSSGPGSPTRIVLRGNRSIQGNNNALIVVDGVAIDNSTPTGQVMDDAGSSGGGHSGSDGVSNINPDDIESISVLKGAAGSVLYGSRAANGVILITTKKGKSGKLSVNVNSGATIDKILITPDFQNEYSQGAGGEYKSNTGSSWGTKMTGQSVTDWNGNTVSLNANPDNFKDFFRSGSSFNNSVSVSGGTDKMQGYLSYTNMISNGIVDYNNLLRNVFNGRLGWNITDRLSADAKITYTTQNIYDKPGVGGDGLVVANIYRIPRSVSLESIKNFQTVDATGIQTPVYWTTKDAVYMNPYWTINNTHRDEFRTRITGLMSVKYKLTNWLSVQGRISRDSYDDFNTQKYANNTVNYSRKAGGYYSEGTDNIAEQNVDFLLSGNNKIGSAFKVSYNLGAADLKRSLIHRVAIADGLTLPNKYDLSFAAGGVVRYDNKTVSRDLQSVYGNAQLSFNDYLYLDVSARNDWSSTLPDPYSYFYPSVGLSAILSDMTTMPSWISYAKLRGSLSRVGNDPDPYMLNQTYRFVAGGFGGYIASNSLKMISDLKPELTKSLEFGTEWRFFNNRLGLDVTYYKTNTINQLVKVSTPSGSGFSTAYINAGNIQNKGVELTLTGKPIATRNFNWDVVFNYATNKNKIIELYPGSTRLVLASNGNVRTAVPVVSEGGSYGDLYGYKWQTLNGKYVVSDKGVPVSNGTLEKVGNFNPDFTLSMGNTFTYKSWSLGVLVDGRFGGEITSGSASQTAYAGTAAITSKYRDANSLTLDAVTADGSKNVTATNAELFWQTVAQGDYGWAEFFTFDATNVRIRELSLGYEFKMLPKAFKSAKLSLIARNLLFLYRGSTILDIPGIGKRKMDFDPEMSFGNSNYQGIEYYNLPSTRSIGLNLKLSF